MTTGNRLILAKLDEPISMSFKEETPPEDALKYIKQATTTSTYSGIPIYVDPIGLSEADKTMTSTVRNMDLEGVPLKLTLELLLKQLDLTYTVKDGLLEIGNCARRVECRPVPSHGALLLGPAGGVLRRLRRTFPAQHEPRNSLSVGIQASRGGGPPFLLVRLS